VAAYLALLRGINVGRAKRVAMADLRAVFAERGFADAKTLLQSGNVVFTAPRALAVDEAAGLESELLRRTGVQSSFLLLSAAEVRAIAEQNPLVALASDPSRLVVSFLSERPDPEQVQLPEAQGLAPEVLVLGERALYQWCPDGLMASRVPPAFWRQLAPAVVTARNWRTVVTLLALLDAAEGGANRDADGDGNRPP